MFARKGIGTLMMLVGLAVLFAVGWRVALGVFLVTWGNYQWCSRTSAEEGEPG